MSAPSDQIYLALQRSLNQEDGLGNFRKARLLAEQWCATGTEEVDLANAYYHLGVIHWLRSTLDRALACFIKAEQYLPEGESLHLLISCFRHVLRMERFNSRLDGAGSSAMEVFARWDADLDQHQLMPQLNAQYEASTDQPIRNLVWYLKDILVSAKNGRNIAERYAIQPFGEYEKQVFEQLIGNMEQTAKAALQLEMSDYVVFPDCLRADILRRANLYERAQAVLGLAESNAKKINDIGRHAYCQLMRGDWLTTKLSHPHSWDFAMADSSQEHSQLHFLVENQEFQLISADHLAKAKAHYGKAESLYQQIEAKGGIGMVYLRYAFIAIRQKDWEGGMDWLQKAEPIFRKIENYRSLMLCRTHQLLIRLQLKQWADIDQMAAIIGRWGRWSGDFSYSLSLGMLVNRFARHLFLRQRRYEGARIAYQVARQLFLSLDAPINAIQCQVDLAYMLDTLGDFQGATLKIEAAANDYMALIDHHPKDWTQREGVAPVLQQHAIMLAAKGFNIGNGTMVPEQMSRFQTQMKRFVKNLPSPKLSKEEWLKITQEKANELQSEHLGDTRIYSMLQLAHDMSVQANFLIPYYHSKIAERTGQFNSAEQYWQEAFSATTGFSSDREPFYKTILWGSKGDFAKATKTFQTYLERTEPLLPPVNEQKDFTGISIDQEELNISKWRYHMSQCVSMWTNLKQYTLAKQVWQRLSTLVGEDWWMDEEQPWKMGATLAEICEGLGELDTAFSYCKRSLDLLEEQRSQLSRDELKTSIANDKGSQFLYLLGTRLSFEQDDSAKAFWYAEQGKARGLLDLLAGQSASIQGLSTEHKSLQLWRELNGQLNALQNLIAHERQQEQADITRMQLWQGEIQETSQSLNQIENKLLQEIPGFHSLISRDGEVLGIERIKTHLHKNQLIIEYYYRKEDLCIWLIDQNGIVHAQHQKLKAYQLVHLAKAFHRECQYKQSPSDLAQELSQYLLLPWIDTILAYSELYIVPSGSLHTIPFHVLPLGNKTLGESHQISYLPSANTLAYLEPIKLPKQPHAFIIGNPTGDLQAAETEATFVAQLFKQEALIGAAATEKEVSRQMPQANILHLATHGNLSEHAPLASSLSLANGAELSLYEIMGMRLQAELVILSACETGRGSTTQGDDVLGLSRGLLAAGAKSAIVSLWQVDDLSTSLFMRYFYEALQKGQHPANALWQAQNTLRRLSPNEIAEQLEQVVEQIPEAIQNQKRSLRGIAINEVEGNIVAYQHPFYWAPFFFIGLHKA